MISSALKGSSGCCPLEIRGESEIVVSTAHLSSRPSILLDDEYLLELVDCEGSLSRLRRIGHENRLRLRECRFSPCWVPNTHAGRRERAEGLRAPPRARPRYPQHAG